MTQSEITQRSIKLKAERNTFGRTNIEPATLTTAIDMTLRTA
jgi:hypothetical protein